MKILTPSSREQTAACTARAARAGLPGSRVMPCVVPLCRGLDVSSGIVSITNSTYGVLDPAGVIAFVGRFADVRP